MHCKLPNEWMLIYIHAFGRHFYPKHSLGVKRMLLALLGLNCCIFSHALVFLFNSFAQESSVCRTVWACTGTSSALIKLETPTVSPSSVLLSSPCWPHAWGASLSSVSNQTSIFQLKLSSSAPHTFPTDHTLLRKAEAAIILWFNTCLCMCVCAKLF